MSSSYRLSDLNNGGENYSSKSGKVEGGFFVSTGTGFILVLVAILISVGVGLIVHLAAPGEVICHCHSDSDHGGVTDGQGGVQPTTPPLDNSTIMALCVEWALTGNTEICTACAAAPTLPPTTPPTAPTIDYRLPTNTRPYHYNVDLQPNMYSGDPEAFNFQGSVKIWIQCLEDTTEITLHAHRLDINYATIEVLSEGETANLYRAYRNDTVRQFLIIELTESMVAGTNLSVSMSFEGPLQGDGTGLYLSSYMDGTTTVYLATTKFEPPYARRAFPCYDEPAQKATFNITLRKRLNTGRNYITLSNMNIINNSTSGDYGIDYYATSVVMPTYLLAFIVCDYEYTESISDTNIAYRTYAKPISIQYAQMAQEHGLRIFNRFESYFTPSYSLPKIDNIAIPDFNSGAMENWGLITYREGLLYIPGTSKASDEKWIAEVISHEIAHQWFGNLVSPKWWSWIWLNEAFASFWDYHIVGELYPSWRSLDQEIVIGTHSVMETDALRSSHPLTSDAESNSEITSLFDSITYAKGSAIVKMMHFIMGQANFIQGLNLYLDKHQYDVAEHQDLWDSLNEASAANNENLNMTSIMDPWVTQANYPVVMVTKTAAGYELTQKRFLIGSTDEEAAGDSALYGYKWPIPISYTTRNNANFTADRLAITMLPVTGAKVDITTDIADEDNWIIINLQQHGYYRVNYDEANWNALIKQLNTNHTVIHTLNRAQIINDAENMAKAGLLDTSIALQTLDFLKNETDYPAWRAFARGMGYVDHMLERTDIYDSFSIKMKNMVEGPLTTLGLEIREEMEHIDIFTITLLASYACKYGVEFCTNEARVQFENWRNNSTVNSIDPNLRALFYCTAVRNGGYEEWNFIYEQYKQEQRSTEKDALREALACSTHVSLLQRVLDMSLNPDEVRPQDIRTTIVYVAQNPLGVDLAWNFFRDRLTELDASMGSSTLARLLVSVTQKFNTQFYLDQIQEMINHGQTASISGSFRTAVEKTEANMEWLNNNYDYYKNWLNPTITPTA
ncbi:hypothetical protein SNE40_007302 [Patella caerulea]|uniref:Aminopeptidase N n=1 Tax=Patella caerulea TaxID=87958 RepID=A0AAN8PUT5_PATCE